MLQAPALRAGRIVHWHAQRVNTHRPEPPAEMELSLYCVSFFLIKRLLRNKNLDKRCWNCRMVLTNGCVPAWAHARRLQQLLLTGHVRWARDATFVQMEIMFILWCCLTLYSRGHGLALSMVFSLAFWTHLENHIYICSLQMGSPFFS